MYRPYYPPPPPPPSPPPPQSRTPWVIIGAGLTLLVLAIMMLGVLGFFMMLRARTPRHGLGLASGGTTFTTSAWTDADSPIAVTSNDPTWGDRTAPVTLVLFADFEDPFAARLAPTIDSLKVLYGAPKLRIVWKNYTLPYHPHARDAAETAVGIFVLGGNDAFWHFEERAFANQKSLDAPSFDTWATESAIDLTKLHAGMSHHDWAPKVDDDGTLAKTVGVTGSPCAFVNGTKVSGAVPMTTWQTTIDDELLKAQAALSGGVAGDRIYVERSKINFVASAAAPTTTYTPPSSTIVHGVPVGSSPVLGRNDALVTIVEFADFQCPYCGRAEATMRALRTKYGSDLRLVWKNEPLSFHVHAAPAAEVALEARDEKGDAMFWIVHDDLFASQATGLEDTQLLRVARDHGLNEARVKSAMTKHSHQTTLDADQLLAKKIGAVGTPAFFINGRHLSGAQPQSSFEAIIDDELVKAKARIATGTARSKIYDDIMSAATD